MKKCLLCEFTADTGDFYQDEIDVSRHYMNDHTGKEKEEYWASHRLPEAEPRTKWPYRGWENRINRIIWELLALGETVVMMDEKMSADERVAFKSKLDELFKYWDRFKEIHNGCRGAEML